MRPSEKQKPAQLELFEPPVRRTPTQAELLEIRQDTRNLHDSKISRQVRRFIREVVFNRPTGSRP